MHTRRSTRLIAITALSIAVLMATVPSVAADPSPTLRSAVDTVRSASPCPGLQSDPLVTRAAEMATQATSDYIDHRKATVPFTDPMPALKTIGYTGDRAELLSGWGANETDSIHGLILQGRKSIPDCSYSRYGVSTRQDDGGFYLTSVVLAG